MAIVDAVVQVAPDSTGKKIRNFQLQTLQSDGSIATVMVQATAVLDEEGNPARFADDHDLRQQTLDELRAIRVGLQLLVDYLHPEASFVRPQVPHSSAGIPVRLPLPLTSSNELIEIAQDLRADEDS